MTGFDADLEGSALDHAVDECDTSATPSRLSRVTAGRGGDGRPVGPRARDLAVAGDVFLHHVLDQDRTGGDGIKRTGDVVIKARYADDFLVGFELERDARAVVEQRRTGWRSSGEVAAGGKTRLIEFGRHAASCRRRRGQGKPETFDFLGFTDDWQIVSAGAFE